MDYRWPKFDLKASIDVADVIHRQGGGRVDLDQLAHLLKYTDKSSGTFNNRVAAAKMFKLIEGRSPNITPTELAHDILSPISKESATEARVRAFQSVPLFAAFFNEYKGHQLPDQEGLENALVRHFGIPEKHAGSVRKQLLKCADQANLFPDPSKRNKMVLPIGADMKSAAVTPKTIDTSTPVGTPQVDTSRSAGKGDAGSPGDKRPGVPSLILGALETIPWSKSLTDEQIEQVVENLRSNLRLHFMFLDERKEVNP